VVRSIAVVLFVLPCLWSQNEKPRFRELAAGTGCDLGTLPPGPLNAITDVPGVRVGHATLIRGARVRTGVTAILPHGGNLYRQKVRGAVFTGNGFGKLMGSTQVNELGEIESPILLTSTLNVARVADAALDYMLGLEGNEDVRSLNVLVGETNDGQLNDIRSRPAGRSEVFEAIGGAAGGAVKEGAAGAGTGTIAFGYKGGIGTASRRVPGGHTVGVLVQSNFGGSLRLCGRAVPRPAEAGDDGSILMVVATDAPVDHRQLMRMAARTIWGLARTGSSGSNGSGDYGIAFTTHREAPRFGNDDLSPLLLGTIEATEEAIYNSLAAAETVSGNGRTVEALDVAERLRGLSQKRVR
jgi:D-aminopeptidase